jgi:N-acetylmuramoyl-L-alanine amidase
LRPSQSQRRQVRNFQSYKRYNAESALSIVTIVTVVTNHNRSELIASRALLLSVAVVRFRIWLATALAISAITTILPRAQVSAEQTSRRERSEETGTDATPSPKPKKSPSPIPKAATHKPTKKSRSSPTPGEAVTAIPRAKLAKQDAESESDTSAKATPRETPEPTPSGKSKRRHSPTPKPKAEMKKSREKETAQKSKKARETKVAREEEETAKPKKTPSPPVEAAAASSDTSAPPARALPVPTPAASPEPKAPRAVPAGERAQVVIEKSGVEDDQGFEPPPSPPPRRFGFWPWSRRSSSYRYLTRSVIEAIRRAPVKRRRWQFIVVHNSGTRQGNARAFDYYHRHVRRMQNGLAYHFVIGNGTSTGNGQIEVGDRWRRQINGGHVHSDYLNNISLGICLVGDFNRDQPTRAQLDSCEELIRYLRERCGKVDRGQIPVRPHREMNPPRWATDCPGDAFPYSWFRRF